MIQKYALYFFTFLCFSFLSQQNAQAQDNEEPNTVFDAASSVDFFLGYSFDFRELGGDLARSRVWSGGVTIGRHFMVGGYTSKLKSENYENFDRGFGLQERYEARLQQGGVLLGVFSNMHNIIHFGITSQFGWGRLEWKDEAGNEVMEDNIVSIMPRLEMEVNLAKMLRLHLFGGYQFLSGYQEPVSGSLNDFSAGIGLRLGSF